MSERDPRVEEVSIEQMKTELMLAGWIKVNSKIWKAPIGKGPAGYWLGPYGAWKAMRRVANATVVRRGTA